MGIRPPREFIESPARFDLSEFDRDYTDARQLAELVVRANEAGDPRLAADAVARGTRSEDELIRICALGSALDFFPQRSLDIVSEIAWFIDNAEQSQTFGLLLTLLGRLGRRVIRLALGRRVTPPSVGPGLIAVHGTVFPLSSRYRANQPDWSIPHRGELFQYLASIRQDIYEKSDYYRWEGGYSDYARIVAIDNSTNEVCLASMWSPIVMAVMSCWAAHREGSLLFRQRPGDTLEQRVSQF
jgi:hypothetical protein